MYKEGDIGGKVAPELFALAQCFQLYFEVARITFQEHKRPNAHHFKH